MIKLVETTVSDYDNIDDQTLREIRRLVWQASQFLSGSSSNEVPYEVVGSLSIALNEWVGDGPVISTALLDSQDFYFVGVEPSIFIKRDIDPEFKLTLIQIAFPKLYKNSPLFNVPLYHELGHFIDSHFKLTEISLLLLPPAGYGPDTPQYQAEKNHRMEYFADLFAACYVGDTVSRFLRHLVGSHNDSYTHPSTDKREHNISTFLSGTNNDVVNLYQDILNKRGLPALAQRFSVPSIDATFDDFRPYGISNDAEMHGMYIAGWDYYENALNNKNPVWNGAEERIINRTINDLVEKSIRNRMILQQWK